MKVKPIPDGYHTINPYMAVRDARGLIAFLKAAFDSSVDVMEGQDGTIFNAEARVGDSMVLIGQVPKDRPDSMLMPMVLYLYVEDADASYRKAMQAGAESMEEPADQVYGDRRAAVRDLAGNQWWFATRKEEVSPEEMLRRFKERKQK